MWDWQKVLVIEDKHWYYYTRILQVQALHYFIWSKYHSYLLVRYERSGPHMKFQLNWVITNYAYVHETTELTVSIILVLVKGQENWRQVGLGMFVAT